MKRIAGLTLLAAVLSCTAEPPPDPAKTIAAAIEVKATVREFDFLAPGEVAVGLFFKNTSDSVMVIDYRTEHARAQPYSGPESGRMEIPREVLDCISFSVDGDTALIAAEQRFSDKNRHHDYLEEGALFKTTSQYAVGKPGYGIPAEVILWSNDPERMLGKDIKAFDVHLDVPILLVPPDSIETTDHWLSGTILNDPAHWLSKEFHRVRVDGHVVLP